MQISLRCPANKAQPKPLSVGTSSKVMSTLHAPYGDMQNTDTARPPSVGINSVDGEARLKQVRLRHTRTLECVPYMAVYMPKQCLPVYTAVLSSVVSHCLTPAGVFLHHWERLQQLPFTAAQSYTPQCQCCLLFTATRSYMYPILHPQCRQGLILSPKPPPYCDF